MRKFLPAVIGVAVLMFVLANVAPVGVRAAGLPDLYPSSVSASLSKNRKTGACTYKLNVTVTNGGTASAGAFYVTFVGADGTVFGRVQVNGLAAGKSTIKSATTGAALGQTATANIYVDMGNAVIESNESNNNTTWSAVCS